MRKNYHGLCCWPRVKVKMPCQALGSGETPESEVWPSPILFRKNTKKMLIRTHILGCRHLNYLEGCQGSTFSLASGPCNECVCSFSKFLKSSILPSPPHSTCLNPICKEELTSRANLSGSPSLPLTTYICGKDPSSHLSVSIHPHPHMAIATAFYWIASPITL